MSSSFRPAIRPTMGDRSEALQAFVERLLAAGPVTAVSALIGSAEKVENESFAGRVRAEAPGRPDRQTLFDLASLTKPMMATLALLLEREGRLSLEQTLGEVWSQASSPVARRTLADLLRHRAGFRSWAPLYELCERPQQVEDVLIGGSLLTGEPEVYSDLGYILWGLAAEALVGRPLTELAAALKPLHEPAPLVAKPSPELDVAECRLDTSREVELAAEQGIELELRSRPAPGEPQDGNARFLGGLGGHAGLFSTARAVWGVAREWLRPTVLSAAAVDEALTGRGPFLLGWRRPRADGGDGEALGPRCFGHTGFTGGSVWIDPAKGRIVVLLAHRAAVTAELDPWRRQLHELAF